MKPYDASYFEGAACKPFLHTGSDTGILLIHGFTGSVAHMRPLGDALFAQHGYTTMGINLPGHATTEADMAKVDYSNWIIATQSAIETLRKHCSRVAVCGLSMGALLSLLLAEEDMVDACISISAPFPSANRLLPFSRILGYVKRRVAWKQNAERSQQLDQQYDKGYAGFPTQKGADLYYLYQKAKESLASVQCPTLVVQSTEDTAVSQTSADTILDGIQSVCKRKLVLHDVPHVCTISEKLPEIVKAMDRLLRTIED